MISSHKTPVALVISGFDPANHAGYGSDIRVMTALGVHPVGVITALTAQIPGRFEAAWSVDPGKITQQLNLLFSYYSIRAIKIGMIQSKGVCEAIFPFLQKFSGHIVVDPLRHASAGKALLNKNAHVFFKNKILRLATLVTPNLPEMLWLLGEKQRVCDKYKAAGVFVGNLNDKQKRSRENFCEQKVSQPLSKNFNWESALDLCLKFFDQYKIPVLLKGGHWKENKILEDIFFDGKKVKRWKRPRLNNLITHGTGCFLSSAITAYLSKGFALIQAVDAAQKKLSRSLQNPIQIDKNNYLSHCLSIPNVP